MNKVRHIDEPVSSLKSRIVFHFNVYDEYNMKS